MAMDFETVVIGVLVLGAFAWALRAGWRSVRQTGTCSSCASSGECPLANNPQALADLTGNNDNHLCGDRSARHDPETEPESESTATTAHSIPR